MDKPTSAYTVEKKEKDQNTNIYSKKNIKKILSGKQKPKS